jgi:hypothetical protein
MAVVKVSVSLAPRVKEMAERRAREQSKPLSRYLGDLVEQDDRVAKDALAAEGYRRLADEMRAEAELAISAAADWLPQWHTDD